MVTNLTPAQLNERLLSGSVTLIDVRELHEHQDERIDGALHMPLSSFNPASVPVHPKKKVVFHCARGGRSANAVAHRDGRLVEMYTFVAVIYFILCFSLSSLVKKLQQKVAIIR